jgi:hypothetical protein
MTSEQVVIRKRRRTVAEIKQIVSAFAGSGLNRSQFCRQQGLVLGTLNSYVKRVREESIDALGEGGLVAVELREMRPSGDRASGGLAVRLASGRRIEVGAGFDGLTLQRLVQVLEML